MLRSIIEPEKKKLDDDEIILRRNLTQDKLVECFEHGNKMWIDITDGTEEEIHWIESTFSIHPTVVSDLLRDDRRPSLLVYPDYLFLSLFQPSIHLNQVDGHEIHCIVGENFFITVRKNGTETVAEAYERVAQNFDSWKRGTPYFLYLTIQHVVDSYYPLLDRISTRLNTLEENILISKDTKISQQSIYKIKQQLINLRQMVAPQREVLSSVIGEERLASTNENRDLFRHLYERLMRIYDVIDSQRDLSSNVLDLLQSQESARLADAVSRLTILSMIFLPLTFLIGLFELNFITTEPELTIPIHGLLMFVVILFLMAVSASTMGWYFRRRGWI